MALLWYDGFDHYADYNAGVGSFDAVLKWPLGGGSAGSVSIVPGRFGGNAIGIAANTTIYRAVTSGDTFVVGFAFKIGSVSSASNILYFRNGATGICALYLQSNGSLTLNRGTTAGTNQLIVSATGLIVANTWYYVEVIFTRNASTGAATIYLNGTQVATGTSLNTGASSIDGIAIFGVSATTTIFDDIYCYSGTTRVGEARVEMLSIAAADGTPQFTPAITNKDTPFFTTQKSAFSYSSGGYFQYTTQIAVVNNWLLAFAWNDNNSGEAMVPNTGWTLLQNQIDVAVSNNNNLGVLTKKITPEDLGLTQGSSTSYDLRLYPLNGAYTSWNTTFAVEFPSDLDLTNPGYAVTGSGSQAGSITIPTITATADCAVFLIVWQTGGTVTTSPVIGGTGVTIAQTQQFTSVTGRSVSLSQFNLASGASVTPTITWSGTPTRTAYAYIVVERRSNNIVGAIGGTVSGDGQYNLAASSGLTDQFTMSSLSTNPSTIMAVTAEVIARKDDATTRSVTPSLVSGGTAGGGTAYNLSSTYALYQNQFELDPHTSAAWTAAAVNALKFNYLSG